jgi:zinc protease
MNLSAIRTRFSAALAVLIIASAGLAQAKVFDPRTFTLANGLQVVVVENHRAPVVTHMVWYRCGAADEKPGKTGIAHFLEHLMFKGTKTLKPGEFSREVARNGGDENAFTGADYTGYFQTIAKDRLELVMRMEADRMTNLVLGPDEVRRERDVVLEERSMRIDNDPAARFYEQLNAVQFLHHPYGTPIIGWRHEMASYSLDDALAFYQRYYAPNNAVLIVAGDIDLAELRPLAEKYYGSIPQRDLPMRQRVQEPPQGAAREIELSDPRVRQPIWLRSYLAPSFTAGATEHAYPLEVLSEILGGTSTSRLYRRLVIEQKLASSVSAIYQGSAMDLATFRLYASPREGVELDALQAAVDAELARLTAEPITVAEVQRAVQRLVAEAVYARDSLSGAARSFGVALTTGQTIADVEAWPERIGAVTAAAVNAAASHVFKREQSVTGRLLPDPDATAAVMPPAMESQPDATIQ